MQTNKTGFFYGTAAEVNVSIGWIPDAVIVSNVTDGDVLYTAAPRHKTMAFTSGGTAEVEAGDVIVGATSGAKGRLLQVLADTGTWAGGDAAGSFIVDAGTVSGTFTSEDVYIEGTTSTDDAGGAALANVGQAVSTGGPADSTGISAYLGSSTPGSEASAGFTVSTGLSEDAKLFRYHAFREANG